MRRLRVSFWVAILVLAVLTGCASSPQARRDKYLAAGKALVQKKDYSRAILAFKNAIRAMPSDAEPYYQLGITAQQAGDLRTSAVSLKRAVELNPKHAGAQLKIAELMAQGDEAQVRKAESLLQEMRQTAPVTPEMLDTLAYTELRLGRTNDAVQTLEELLLKSPAELNSAILLARAKLGTKDVKGAEAVLQRASAAAPKAAQPHVVLGEFYRATNRIPDAEMQLRTALTLDPNNVQALYSLAGTLYSPGRMQEVEATFKRLAGLPESPYKPIYGLFLLRQGRKEDAVFEFERLAKQDPKDHIARSRLVSVYQMVGRMADAEKVLEEALKKNSKDIDALVQRAQLSVASRRYENAEKDLNKVLQLQPESALAHYLTGKLHLARGQELTSRQDLFKAVQLDPMLLNARLDLAQSFITSKDPKGALDVLNAAPESQRSLLPVIVQRNWALWAMGDTAEMRKSIDAGLALQRSTDLLVQDGIWKLRSGNASAARTSLEEALKINPADVRALAALMESHEVQNGTAVAVEKVKEYAAQEPRSAPVQNFLGTILLARGDRAGARSAFQAAKAAAPGSVEADLSLTEADVLDGKLEDARGRLQAVLSANPTNTTAHLWLGDVGLLRADYGGAEKQFRVVIAADPGNPQALNNLAYLLTKNGGQPSEALKYAQKAKELAPDKPEYSDTLGWVLYQQGLYPSAVRELERASAKGANPVWKYHLAMAYAKAGDGNRARSVLQSALKQNSQLPEAKLAQQIVDAEPSKQGNGR
jgi:tetratricopeptide (TPR) repeat protein